jgi:hypothetical protein
VKSAVGEPARLKADRRGDEAGEHAKMEAIFKAIHGIQHPRRDRSRETR